MIKKSIIAAYSIPTEAIGINNSMPWHDKEDLQRFKSITSGSPIIMGRKTHESIGKLLPNRVNIIVTSNKDYIPVDTSSVAVVTFTLDAAIQAAEEECRLSNKNEIFFIGGAEIYKQALPLCDRVYLSQFKKSYDGDTFFPVKELKSFNWNVVESINCKTHFFKILEKEK